MKYLLDTCCVSDFVKGDIKTHAKIKLSMPSDLALSSVTLLEIEYGLLLNTQRAKKIRKPLKDFTTYIPILSFDEETAIYAAKIRSHLKKHGTPIDSYDVLIAATAQQHQLTLVTSNEKEFKRVPEIALENWRNE
jgi:tRNA(fMet)-specific endonuclease VapC